MISVTKAHKEIRAVTPKPQTEIVAVQDASGRVLGQALVAPFDMPMFTNSAMDGYAVRFADVHGSSPESPKILTQIGVIAAGTEPEMTVEKGECAQIMTGAPIPKGADCVVKVEDTSGFEEEPIKFFAPSPLDANIRKAGEEVKAGDLLLSEGATIGPGEIGSALGCGLTELTVYAKPVVAVMTTGSELMPAGSELERGQIYNTNQTVLADLTQLLGCNLVSSSMLPDDRDMLKAELSALLGQTQLLVTSGGVSMGRFDHLKSTLLELGVEEIFWRVSQKPGSPLFFGKRDDTLIFGLPGNPVSAMIVFMEYVWPVIQKMQGQSVQPKVNAVLSETFPRLHNKHRFLFGKAWFENNRLLVEPSSKHGSHMFTSALGANCIIEGRPGEGQLPQGREVRVMPLPWTRLAGSDPHISMMKINRP